LEFLELKIIDGRGLRELRTRTQELERLVILVDHNLLAVCVHSATLMPARQSSMSLAKV
jgi:hypothetical protein